LDCDEGGPPRWDAQRVIEERARGGPSSCCTLGWDLSRRKVDVCSVSSVGEIVDEWASPPDADGLRGLAATAAMRRAAVCGVIESMNGARFVHDRLEEHGWDV
jgi:transposase